MFRSLFSIVPYSDVLYSDVDCSYIFFQKPKSPATTQGGKKDEGPTKDPTPPSSITDPTHPSSITDSSHSNHEEEQLFDEKSLKKKRHRPKKTTNGHPDLNTEGISATYQVVDLP